jgi:hypothetical protein
MNNMFDLEESIAGWRKQMLADGIQTPVPMEELESHLREDVEEQVRSGVTAQQAFEMTVQKIGQGEALRNEFARAGEPIYERLKKLFYALAGIPNYQLATNMNTTNTNIEPRWATYAKAGTFLFPAAFLWLFTCVFVLPKAKQVCEAAGMTVFGFDSAPAVFRMLGTIGQLLIFCSSHWLLTGSSVVMAFLLLERFFDQWPRYRRVAIGAGVLLANACVLLALALMVISILIAAPILGHAH